MQSASVNIAVGIEKYNRPTTKIVSTKRGNAADVRSLFGIAKGVLPQEYENPDYDPCYKELIGKLREESRNA